MVKVVVIEFSVMRCQPLRRALVGNALSTSKRGWPFFNLLNL
ncbi:acetyltransferase [Vibrio mimicus]